MNKILFIEDDNEYAKIIVRLLEKNNFSVDYVDNSVTGIELAQKNVYDLIILDLYMDKFLGTQVVEFIKVNNSENKFIIISNSSDPNDEIKSLKLDIDDFIRKDSSLEVFIERVTRVLKRKISNTKNNLLLSSSENIEVDVLRRSVKKNGKQVKLTALEFDLLVYFLSAKNELLSRDKIIEDVWKLPSETVSIDLRNIDSHVKNLRSKLNISAIMSIRGIGYRWYEE